MAILEIRKFNEPGLRKKSEEIKKITPEIKKLAKDMIETMVKGRGVGLAGPQVGVLKRIITAQLNLLKPDFLVLINPRVIRKGRIKETGEEGCLSFPDIFIDIERPNEVEVEALDLDGNKVKIKAEGMPSRILQHEIDHLDGIIFFHRLKFSDKLKFKIKHPKIKTWL